MRPMASEWSILPAQRETSTDRRIAGLAARQHGVVTREQLLALGLSSSAIGRRVAHGLLHRLHVGVYAVGHSVLSTRGRWTAAVLAAGSGAVLSHRAAAVLWDIRRGATIEVTAPTRRRRSGIVIHCATLARDEVTARDGIPTTTVARTLFDLAAVTDRQAVDSALHEAEYQGLTDVVPLVELLERHPHARGTAILRELLAIARLGIDRSRSELEDAFHAFVDEHRLPRPRRNAQVLGYTCDCVWHEAKLVVELDGGVHRTTRRFHSDRERDRRLAVAGWTVIRVTWRHLLSDRAALAADLRALLASAAAGPLRSW